MRFLVGWRADDIRAGLGPPEACADWRGWVGGGPELLPRLDARGRCVEAAWVHTQ